MNTIQLQTALKNETVTKRFFTGIYSYDTLLNIKMKPKLIICNTEPSYKKGEHWVPLFFNKNNVEFFDSLGKPMSYYSNNFITCVKKFAKYFKENKKRVQPVKSSLCGQYCLYFAYLKCKGYSMEFIMKTMSNSKNVKKYVNRKFKYK
jgi:hypothetical protein